MYHSQDNRKPYGECRTPFLWRSITLPTVSRDGRHPRLCLRMTLEDPVCKNHILPIIIIRPQAYLLSLDLTPGDFDLQGR